ncbi:MAG: metalloendopeptidase [Alphaproteobacteria bacterium]|nr:MAG: metalloendopeptidase [Alphaproteobacteria bacterium]
MTTSGEGIYFDGITAARRPVSIELGPDKLSIRSTGEGFTYVRWPYADLEHLAAPAGLLRLGLLGAKVFARLEVRDHDLAAAIDARAASVDRARPPERRGRLKVAAWSVAAAVSLVAGAVYGVPALADRIAPLVPLGLEHRLGGAVEVQVRAMLDEGRAGAAFECGAAPEEAAGRAALGRLVGALESAAALPIRIRVTAVRRRDANAMALPGGRIYLFAGLIDRANTPDELAAVIAHEIGHVAGRDGMRAMLQAAGLSVLFGMLLGDFVGGGAVVVAANATLRSSYSRGAEAAADAYAVALVRRIGGDPRALAAVLGRIGGLHPEAGLAGSHPATRDRAAAIEAAAPPVAPRALLAPEEWAALKRLCG